MVIEALTAAKNDTCPHIEKLRRADDKPVAWHIFEAPQPYQETMENMRRHARALADGRVGEAIWMLEHPPLYSAGTSAKPADLLRPDRFPVFEAGRGGQYTYHGPGQRVAYVMLDLASRGRDVRCFVQGLENWIIETLAAFNIKGERRDGRVGVWVRRPDRGPDAEDKIAAIGVRVSRWASFHGISINIAPNLDHYSGIIPCGIRDHGVTSLEDLGQLASIAEVDMAMKSAFEHQFGTVKLEKSPL